MATIKISQLPSLGNAVAANTLLPVVNTAGVYTTDKASVGNIGNFVLTQAGNTLPAAFLSTYSQTVTNAAQPNITSTGTLSNLTVSGNANIANINVDILNLNGLANLGDVGNLTIGGGLNGYVLQTDGSGTLSWTAQTGGGGGNATPAGANTQIQFNDSGNFGGEAGFTFDKTDSTLSVGNIVISANLSGDYATFTHDVTANIFYGNYIYGDASNLTNLPVGNISSINLDGNASNLLAGNGAWISSSTLVTTPAGSNTQIQYNNNGSFGASSGLTYNNTTSTLTAGNIGTGNLTTTGIVNVNNNQASINPSTGALKVSGGLGVQGNIHGNNEIHSFGNVKVGGQSLFLGASADATGLTNPTLIIFHSGANYVQAALKNSLSSGSADWVAYGDNGTEEQGWADFGFTSSMFNDPDYTITGPGDGYFFVESFAGSYGGNLVLATGSLGTVNDIIFATGGFDANNEFARIEDSNNLFHLTRAGSGIKFHDGSIQTTAFGLPLANGNSNFDIATANGNITITANTSNTWTFGDDGTLLLPRDVAGNTDPYLWITGGPAPSISSVDVSLAGPANFQIVSDYLNLSGYSGAKVAIKADNGEIATDANMILSTNNANVSSIYSWTFSTDGTLTLPGNTFAINFANGTQASAPLVDVLNTNGLTTVFYPTFVENRLDGQIVRADVDLSYRTDTNTLTVGNISGNTNGYTLGYLNIPQIAASNTTLALTDAGKHYYSTTAGNLTLTIPLNSSVAFPTGTAVSIVVQAAGNVLVNAAAGVTLYMAGSSTAGNRVVGTYGMATLMKVASDTWFINGTGVY